MFSLVIMLAIGKHADNVAASTETSTPVLLPRMALNPANRPSRSSHRHRGSSILIPEVSVKKRIGAVGAEATVLLVDMGCPQQTWLG